MNTIFRLKPRSRGLTDEELLDDLRRVAAEFGSRRITLPQYRDRGNVCVGTLRNRFGTWLKAVQAASLQVARNHNIPTEELFANLAEVWIKVGEQPTYEHIESALSRYSPGPYTHRFGSFRLALEAFVAWANDQNPPLGLPPGYPTKARHTRRTPNWRQRALVLMRDGATCRMCGARPEHGAQLQVDHIVPWAKGGETVLENLQILCRQCNMGKSDVDPIAAKGTNNNTSSENCSNGP